MTQPSRTHFALSLKPFLFTVLCAGAFLADTGRVRAALLAYEGFDYAVGTSVVGQNGGANWSNAWQINGSGAGSIYTNRAGSLSYTDSLGNALVTSGNHGYFAGSFTANNTAQPNRDLTFTRSNGTTWISFLGVREGIPTNTIAGNPYPRGANLAFFNGASERIAIGNATAATSNTWGILPANTASQFRPATVSFTQQVFIVLRIDHLGDTNAADNAYLFINPTLSVEPDLGTANTNAFGIADHTLNRIRPFAGGYNTGGTPPGQPNAQFRVDEIRIGETYADVTPFLPAGGNPPGLTVDLTNKLAELCANAAFIVNATGTPPLNYFWSFNNAPAGGNSNSLMLNNLTSSNAGSYFVIVSNATGTATSSVVSLTLTDTTAPTITQCATNQSLISNGSCQSQIPDVTNQIAATDCTGIASITQSPGAGTVVGVGEHVVTISVTDNSNNVATCQATVTVVGSGAPVLVSCASDQFLNADINQQAIIPNLAAMVVATNPCGSVTVTQSPPAGSIVGPGVQVVTLTAVSASGITNCTASVTVNARPVATGQSVATALNTPLNLVLGGSDADGGPLTFQIASNPTHGVLGPLNSNLVTYTPTTFYVGADAFTFAVSDGSVTSAVATVSISVTNADIIYPATPQIVKDGTTVLLENYANAPLSSRTMGVYPPVFDPNGQLSRINFMRPEPTNAPGYGLRYFVCDLNRNLYIVPKANPLATNTWIRYLTLEEIFPRFDNDPGFAGGLTTFAFDPEYATNGLFYTVHMETTAATLGPTNGAYPSLNLTGYTTTTAINPPSGAVNRIAVLIEWRDTNVANTTFEGTAREILRFGFLSTIHPLGDLLYNPNALPGHLDYRNLYLATGDGASGETAGTTHTHPQQLNTIVGKILRLTPDLNLRPTDELSGNGRYRIPTNGPDPNPFVFTNSYFTNLAGVRHEIYAYGFRNPHRMSWDALSGGLFVNDIGLNSWEEINLIRKGTNYGWAEREGPEQLFVPGSPGGVTGSRQTIPVPFPASDLLTVTGIAPALTPTYPVAAYSSRDGDAISSGFVYRGTLMPGLYGKYIFGDITTARLFFCNLEEMLAADDGVRTTLAPIHEIQIAFDSPHDSPDQGVTNRRLFDIVSEAYHQKGGTNPNALPGGATVTSLTNTNLVPGGVPFGGGRADIRLAVGDDKEIYVIGKSDASIRKLAAALGPPTILSLTNDTSSLTLTWQSFPGRSYRVQFKPSLAVTNWSDLAGDVAATGLTASKATPLSGEGRFFRVKLLP